MKVLSIIAIFLLLAIICVILVFGITVDVLKQPDGKYLIVRYTKYTKCGTSRGYKLFKL